MPVTLAQSDGVRILLDRAASMLISYGELIRRDGASRIDEHHYLPEVEHVAAELRALMEADGEYSERSRVFARWMSEALLVMGSIDPDDDSEDGGQHLRMLIDRGRRLVDGALGSTPE